MTKTFLLFALSITVSTSFTKDILLECGTSTRTGFNGWTIQPYAVFDTIIFTDETIDFYAGNNGGDFTISLTRKIEAMKEYAELDLAVEINSIHGCVIHSIDAFFSEDGKSWTFVKLDQSNFQASINNEKMDYQFLKIAVNVSFEPSGYLQCGYVKIEGENNWEMALIEPEPQIISNPFFVFCFNKTINVETKSEQPYDVIFTSISGQIVYTETAIGSNRIETDLPDGIYIISIFQNGEFLQSKKVIF